MLSFFFRNIDVSEKVLKVGSVFCLFCVCGFLVLSLFSSCVLCLRLFVFVCVLCLFFVVLFFFLR